MDATDSAEDGGGEPEEDEGSKDAASGTAPLPGNSDDFGVKRMVRSRYNYGKMVSYANKYWKHPNSAYRTYGTDCTNFISQAMRAGGWVPHGAIAPRTNNRFWFYGSSTLITSYTWAAAENWYWFAKKHSQRTKILDNVWKMAKADVLQADWGRDNTIDHTMIVTKKYRGTPYLTYHTSNTHDKSLKKLLSDHPRAWWYAHRT
ncbi:amidase domain-containing protein [Streptomyces sp. Amel2xC10]|uniref:amidase domain-containing protein n=1 Tax=Streptomyces sp. Amel2xC10 TaxID=1305826 RepID=UPI00117FA902|nr:amidase domain-containing protein [Streptomyces sp. Amel2xC10]